MVHEWINGLLGLVVAGILFVNLSETTLTWTLVIVGLAITLSSFWGIVSETEEAGTHGSRSHI